jgi:hypothetical protein
MRHKADATTIYKKTADKRGWDFYVLAGRMGANWALAVPMIRPAKRGGRPHIPQRAAPLTRASSTISQTTFHYTVKRT